MKYICLAQFSGNRNIWEDNHVFLFYMSYSQQPKANGVFTQFRLTLIRE